MACERWWLSSCNSYVNLLLFIAIVAVGFSAAEYQKDGHYYHYDVVSSSARSENFHAVFKELVRDRRSIELVRNQRSPIEPLPPKNETNTNNTSILHPLVTPKSNSSSENVAYSTDNGTAAGTGNSTTSQPSITTHQTKPDILVSQPLNPTTGQVDPVHVWANKTRDLPTEAPQVQNGTGNASKPSQKNANDDDISIDKFDDLSNSTLSQNNITKTEEDTHQYYNSTFSVDEADGRKYWVDMVNHPNLMVNDLLSESHRRAATVKLSFDFPFYGHMVRNVTIATGGFLYTGEYVHSWLAATQYIAPLMANFDTRLSNNSYVKYADNGTAFTVEWEKVVLQDRSSIGEFTFQATLHKNGDIVFVYKDVPLVVDQIEDHSHPVKVGLSDAYIIDRTVFFVRRKTIYEYHRVNFKSQNIRNWTVIYLRALPTCLGMGSCEDCLNRTTGFDCKWCPTLNRCSTGTDRHRQEWILKRCETKNIREVESCPATTANATTYDGRTHDDQNVDVHEGTVHAENVSLASVQPSHQAESPSPLGHTPDKVRMGVSGIIGILLVITLIAGLVGWAVYAYRNPHSASGQVLIRYRPSQWSWRRGEARYTAATIHM